MAKKTYIGINNVAREVKKIYIGVNGIARNVKKVYIGDDNGIARLVYEQNYAITYFGATDTLREDILYTAKAGDTVYGDIAWDSNVYPSAYIIIASAHSPYVYSRTEVEDYSGMGSFSFVMPSDDIKVYILIEDSSDNYDTVIGESYALSDYTYDSTNIYKGSLSGVGQVGQYVEAGTSISMSFRCNYLGNVTAILRAAKTGQVLETKIFTGVGNTSYANYSFLMPFADVTVELTYEPVDLIRPIIYLNEATYNDVDYSYLPGIPSSAQIGSTVDLTPWFENSPNGYTVSAIEWSDERGSGDWVVGDGYGDLIFEMPSREIVVMTNVPDEGGEEPDDPDTPVSYSITYAPDSDITDVDGPSSASSGVPVNITFHSTTTGIKTVQVKSATYPYTLWVGGDVTYDNTGPAEFSFTMPSYGVVVSISSYEPDDPGSDSEECTHSWTFTQDGEISTTHIATCSICGATETHELVTPEDRRDWELDVDSGNDTYCYYVRCRRVMTDGTQCTEDAYQSHNLARKQIVNDDVYHLVYCTDPGECECTYSYKEKHDYDEWGNCKDCGYQGPQPTT